MTSSPAPFLFLRKFLQHGTRVASVAPSSRALAAAMCRHVTPDRPQTLLELGAGTGAVTQAIARRMHPRSRLVAVEVDPDFADLLRHQCPCAEVICADALHLEPRLAELDLPPFDAVLSGLPTPSLPRAVNLAVFATLQHALAPDGVFSQLTVMPWIYWPTYRRLFERVAFDLVPANVPPGGVYHCTGLKPRWREAIPGKP